MATIQDVAKVAGVSVATVSRVFNNSQIVSAKTREKVDRAIEALNYEPSALGRNLRTSKSNLILVLIPSISNPFYTKIINGIEDTVIDQGYSILLCETDSNPDRESIYFNLIRNRLAEGIISMDPTINKERLLKLAEKHPIIQCSEYDKDGPISYVTINHKLASYQAVKHLISLGHERIAFINSEETFLYARERHAGYVQAMEEHHLPIKSELILHKDGLAFEDGQKAMKHLLELPEKPTALFAVSDMLAIGALKELHKNELKVPEDMALVGFDNIDFSKMTYPSLTTVAQPMYQMGCLSAEKLLDKINDKPVESAVLDHELIIRSST